MFRWSNTRLRAPFGGADPWCWEVGSPRTVWSAAIDTSLAERALLQGQNKIDTLFSAMKVLVLDEHDLARRGFSPSLFRNLNTPEEFEQARRQRSLVGKK